MLALVAVKLFLNLSVSMILALLIYHQLVDAVYATADGNVPGCYNNGTWYANGSMVPTIEPCLNCKCINRNLICALRVCPEQPIPPPRGCVLVQGKHSCCPYLMCIRYHNKGQDRRGGGVAYIQHWENEEDHDDDMDKLRMSNGNSVLRRVEDVDSPDNSISEACVHNGTVYESGSAMATSSLCSYCYCIGGKQRCIKPKCTLAPNGCKPIFADAACCPVRYNCQNQSSSTKPMFKLKSNLRKSSNKHYLRTALRNQRSSGCLIGAYFYSDGQKLPVDPENPCDICYCIRGGRKCTPKKCTPSIKNCKPIVPIGQCCPASYECYNTNELSPRSMSDVRPRQFDLFSLFFGEEHSTNNSTDTSIPLIESPSMNEDSPPMYSSTSEKSFFDAIRDGLNYLDSNDGQVGALLDSSINATEKAHEKLNQTKEFSLFDLLMGDEDLPAVTHQPVVLNQEITATELASSNLDPISDRLSEVFHPNENKRPLTVELNPIDPLTESPLKTDIEEREPSFTDLFSGILSNNYEDYSYTDPAGLNITDYIGINEKEEMIEHPVVRPEAQETKEEDGNYTKKQNNQNEAKNVPLINLQKEEIIGIHNTKISSTKVEDVTTEQVFIVKPASKVSDSISSGTKFIPLKSNILSTTKSPVIIYMAESSKSTDSNESTESSRLNEVNLSTEVGEFIQDRPSEKNETTEFKKPNELKKQSELNLPTEYNRPSEVSRPIVLNSLADVKRPSNKPIVTETEIYIPIETSRPTQLFGSTETIRPTELSKPTKIIRPSELNNPTEVKRPAEFKKPTESVELNTQTNVSNSAGTSRPADVNILRPSDIRKPIDLLRPPVIKRPTDEKRPTNILLPSRPLNTSRPTDQNQLSDMRPTNINSQTYMNMPFNFSSPPEIEEPIDIIKLPDIINSTEISRLSQITRPTVTEPITKTKPSKFSEVSKISSTPAYSNVRITDSKPLLASSSTENLIAVLFDGISNILNGRENTTKINKTNLNKTSLLEERTTSISATNKKPLVVAVSKPEVTQSSPNTSTPMAPSMNLSKISLTTVNPENIIVISSNPSILETDINYDYDEPTLPPSLPNLKIIPFLPTDAVKNDRNQFAYDFHKSNYQTTAKYPILTEKYPMVSDYPKESQIHNIADYHGYEVDQTDYPPAIDEYSFYKLQGNAGGYADKTENKNSKIDYGYYDHQTGSYPTFTENYDSLNSNIFATHQFGAFANDGGDSEKINEYPLFDEKYDGTDFDYDSFGSPLINTAQQHGNQMSFGGSQSAYDSSTMDQNVFTKIGFNPPEQDSLFPFDVRNNFSPPNKTEGGFVPKQPNNGSYFYDKWTTKLMDFVTEAPLKNNLTRLLRGKPPDDSLDNAIKTETLPDLHSLFQSKENKNKTNSNSFSFNYSALRESTNDDFEKDIISITTDSSYPSFVDMAKDHIIIESKKSDSNKNSTNVKSSANHENSTNIKMSHIEDASLKNSSSVREKLETTTKRIDFVKTDDFLESVFGFLFRDDQSKDELAELTEPSIVETKTIPPFKNISSTMSLLDILNFTKPKNGTTMKKNVPQRINDKIFDPTTELTIVETTTGKPENLNILRDVLLATLNKPDDPIYKPRPEVLDGPFLKHPIHHLPFISPIFPAQDQHIDSKNTFSFNPIRSDLDLIITELNKDSTDNNNYSPEGYQLLPEYSSISNTKSYVVNPVDIEKLKRHQSEGGAQIYSKPLNSNPSPINTMGLLKLAGCNIYGRMYRVGRIISELSGPCLECKCTEVGVHCTPLKC